MEAFKSHGLHLGSGPLPPVQGGSVGGSLTSTRCEEPQLHGSAARGGESCLPHAGFQQGDKGSGEGGRGRLASTSTSKPLERQMDTSAYCGLPVKQELDPAMDAFLPQHMSHEQHLGPDAAQMHGLLGHQLMPGHRAYPDMRAAAGYHHLSHLHQHPSCYTDPAASLGAPVHDLYYGLSAAMAPHQPGPGGYSGDPYAGSVGGCLGAPAAGSGTGPAAAAAAAAAAGMQPAPGHGGYRLHHAHDPHREAAGQLSPYRGTGGPDPREPALGLQHLQQHHSQQQQQQQHLQHGAPRPASLPRQSATSGRVHNSSPAASSPRPHTGTEDGDDDEWDGEEEEDEHKTARVAHYQEMMNMPKGDGIMDFNVLNKVINANPADIEIMESLPKEELDAMMHQASRKGKGGRTPAADPRDDPNMDPKKAKRIIANRQSAAKSKMKQKMMMEALRTKYNVLQKHEAVFSKEVKELARECDDLEAHCNELQQEVEVLLLHLKPEALGASNGGSGSHDDGPSSLPRCFAEQQQEQHLQQHGLAATLAAVEQLHVLPVGLRHAGAAPGLAGMGHGMRHSMGAVGMQRRATSPSAELVG